MERPEPSFHYVTVSCPECGGDIPYEVESQPPLDWFGHTRWIARDLDRECACQVWEPEPGLSDEDAHEKTWRALDQQAIAAAKQQAAQEAAR